MNHVHGGTCAECERDIYVLVVRNDEPRSLNTLVDYHLGERCAITPSYGDLHELA
jgi:hypothetical protein